MKTRIFSAILIILFVTACNGTFEIGIEHPQTDGGSLAATPTPVVPPTSSHTPSSTIESKPSATKPVPTMTQVLTDQPTSHMVQIFLIAMEDNGQTGVSVGCGDSAVPVQVETPPTQGVLKAALEALLSVKVQYYGQSGLYNALYRSNLQVDRVSIDSGIASVYLTGNLIMGGECDNPRVQAQLEQTVLQFPNVTEADIYINGKTLADALSLKGTGPQPSPTSQAPTQSVVKIFLIAVGDNGKTGSPVGCGDSATPVQVELPSTQGVLKAALGALLSVEDRSYGQSGLYNALYQSDLQMDSISIVGSKASVYLTGTLVMGGECDSPRVQAQLEQTVLQFPSVTDVAIFINGKPLAEALSLK